MADVTYNIVKGEDIASAMRASGLATGHQRKSTSQDAIVWNQTVSIIMERVDLSSVARDTSKEGIQKVGKTLKGIMANHIQAETEIPLRGKNRKGEDFDVSGKDGVKWGSWDKTRRIFAYLGDIAKIISYGHEGVLYPEKYKVGARCDILKQCKVVETPLKAIDRLSAQLQENLDVMTVTADVLHAHNAVNGLLVNNLDPVIEASSLINKLDGLMDIMEKSDLDKTRTFLTVLTKYFKS